MRSSLLAAIESLDADPGVRAIVLLGAGDHFVAGADLTEFDQPPLAPFLPAVLGRLEACGKPVVAALHGATLGGGAETALACHYRCAAGDLQLGFPEVTLGLLPGAGGTVRLPRLAGWQAAFELMTGGKPIGVDAAIELGIVDRRMDGELRSGAIAWARELASAGAPPRRVSELPAPPSREVMGILKDHFYYFNPASGLHQSRARDPDDPMNLHISAFQALANGDQDLLHELYKVSFFSEPGHWYMILSDRNGSQSQVRITVSGAAGQPAERIEIHEADGDRAVYRLAKDAEGESVRAAVLRLEAELTGQ
ncbi:MAG: enoyl-CoA hydratase/isomerase family protein [Methylococcaceae bacterium]|nr:enoyl-CoA hydratase/isomerase family protein [Methylococcaceae bacterium]